MYGLNFCVECGAPIARKPWRVWRGHFCEPCGHAYGRRRMTRFVIAGLAILLAGFSLGRHFRPPPPPLVIERSANSPLSDLPVNLSDQQMGRRSSGTAESDSPSANRVAAAPDDTVYLCGARTKKGTPCRRRVHSAGERCYQHKGKPAMLPLDKLIVKDG